MKAKALSRLTHLIFHIIFLFFLPRGCISLFLIANQFPRSLTQTPSILQLCYLKNNNNNKREYLKGNTFLQPSAER